MNRWMEEFFIFWESLREKDKAVVVMLFVGFVLAATDWLWKEDE